MISRSSYSTSQIRKFLDKQDGDIVYNLSQSHARLGFQIQCENWLNDTPLEEYFTIRVFQKLDKGFTEETQYYRLEAWDDEFYGNLFNQNKINSMIANFGNIYWIPKSANISVSSLNKGEWSQNIHLTVEHWISDLDNGVNWRSTQEILNAIDNSKVKFLMKSNYFDFTDLDNPVKFFIREEQVRLTSIHTKYSYLTLKENEYLIDNDPYWDSDHMGFFYSFDQFQNDLSINSYGKRHQQSLDPALFLEVKMSISEEIEIYERIVYSFLDLTGQIGGIYELMEITAAFFVGYYNKVFYNYELANKIKTSECENYKRKSYRKHKCLDESEQEDLSNQASTNLKTDSNSNLVEKESKYSIKDLCRSLCTFKWWINSK